VSIFEVAHQPRAQRILQLALAGGRLPHAYIFAGPRGVGRRMLAERFAAVLLCGRPSQVAPPTEWTWGDRTKVLDSCGECEDCVALQAGTHPDFHAIDRQLAQHHPDPQVRARKGLDLSIEVIRHFVLERVTHKPIQGRAKVFIIHDADEMSTGAQNAMLKTLEEPPGTTFLILRSRSAELLLPTTRSRCQVVSFSALPTEFVERQLIEQHGIKPAVAHFAARYSEGQLGWAVEQLQEGLLERRAAVMRPLAEVAADSALGVAKVLREQASAFGGAWAEHTPDVTDAQATRKGVRGILCVVASVLRDALNLSLGRDDEVANVDQMGIVRQLAGRTSTDGLLACIEAIGQAGAQIDRNANVQLTLEGLCIRLGRSLAGRGSGQYVG
jgi:DNA polymerase-3 subunit delta'